MAKYYVYSGSLRFVGNAENPTDAALCAFESIIRNNESGMPLVRLGRNIVVNEQGFDRPHDNDLIRSTKSFLEELGFPYTQ